MSFFGSIGNALKGAAKFAAPIALSTLIPGVGGAIAGGVAGKVLGGGGSEPPGATGGFSGPYGVNALMGGGGDTGPAIPDDALGIEEGGLSGLVHKAGSWLGGNGGKNALGLAQGVNATLQQHKASELAKKALGSAEGAYNERAPLRQMGVQGLLNSQVGNPYAVGGH